MDLFTCVCTCVWTQASLPAHWPPPPTENAGSQMHPHTTTHHTEDPPSWEGSWAPELGECGQAGTRGGQRGSAVNPPGAEVQPRSEAKESRLPSCQKNSTCSTHRFFLTLLHRKYPCAFLQDSTKTQITAKGTPATDMLQTYYWCSWLTASPSYFCLPSDLSLTPPGCHRNHNWRAIHLREEVFQQPMVAQWTPGTLNYKEISRNAHAIQFF